LNVWRYCADRAVAALEFLLKDCLVRAARGHRVEYLAGSDAAAAHHVAPSQTTEIHRLFRWVVPNIARVVPADVREFLRRFSG
jgi:hypothetical protein